MTSKQRLIAAAQELFWERGFAGTSPKAIQDKSGARQGSMYHHFTGKTDLGRQAMEATSQQMQVTLNAEFESDGMAIERIERYLRRSRDVLRGCRVGRMTSDPEVLEDPELRQPVAAFFDWLEKKLTEVLAEGQKRGELVSELDPVSVAATISATLQGGYVLSRAAGSPKPFKRAVDGILSLLETQRLR